MEEKEIIFHIEKNEESLKISSSVDDDYEYLSIEETIAIIIELVNYVIEKMIKDAVIQNFIATEEKIKDEKVLEELDRKIADFTGILIHRILNFTFDKDLTLQGKEFPIDYSLIVYGPSKNKKNREVYEIFNYLKVRESEKLSGCFTLFKTIIDSLFQNNTSETKIKESIDKAINILTNNIYKYIHNYNTSPYLFLVSSN